MIGVTHDMTNTQIFCTVIHNMRVWQKPVSVSFQHSVKQLTKGRSPELAAFSKAITYKTTQRKELLSFHVESSHTVKFQNQLLNATKV